MRWSGAGFRTIASKSYKYCQQDCCLGLLAEKFTKGIIYPHTWPWNMTVNLNDLCETWRMVSLLYWWHHSNQMDENGVMYLDFPNQAIMTWLAHSVRSVSVNMWLIQWVMSSSKCDPFGRKCHRQTVTSSVGNTVRLWPVQWEMSSSNCCFQV